MNSHQKSPPRSVIKIVGDGDRSKAATMSDASAIMQAWGAKYHSGGTGALSMKSFFGAPAWYDVNGSKFKVTKDRYLLLNENQSYEITKDHHAPYESFVLFFRNGIANDVHRTLTQKQESLLDCPLHQSDEPINFYERSYSLHDPAGQALLKFRSRFRAHIHDNAWLDSQLYRIVEQLIAVHCQTITELTALKFLRATTRDELYRRLHRAREYIIATAEQPFVLRDVASIACMSPNHLLRTFKQLFGQTPHQFLDDLRLHRAKSLLGQGHHTVYDVCVLVGFQSLGSFSHWFRRRTGSPPSQFAAAKKVISKKSRRSPGS